MNILTEQMKEAIVECLRKNLDKHPDNLGMLYGVLKEQVESKISDSTFSEEFFCQDLTELVKEQKIVILGAIRKGLVTLVLKTA